MKKKIVVLRIILLSTIISLAGCTSTTNNDKNTNNNDNSPPQQNETEIRIPLSGISTTASFYSYDSAGVTIRYFVVKDAQGTAHVAFDACDVCYEAKKGYKQEGVQMQCLNCGKQFAITSIGTENTVGGCWPSYLHMRLDGDNLVIRIADLEAKRFMF